ncbi:hypothetical protein H4Q26_017371 [Puccinia striiformis f. sp. tritici PST-130]|nr:hypothetical protein H4Q26_017371 [Puccinia striiformis f. sp. tritici PST-130]
MNFLHLARVDVCGAQVTNTNAEPPTDKQHICSQEIAQLETVKETVPKSSAIAANPPNSSSAPINCFDLYYPGLKDRTHSFLKGLSAPNRALWPRQLSEQTNLPRTRQSLSRF